MFSRMIKFQDGLLNTVSGKPVFKSRKQLPSTAKFLFRFYKGILTFFDSSATLLLSFILYLLCKFGQKKIGFENRSKLKKRTRNDALLEFC